MTEDPARGFKRGFHESHVAEHYTELGRIATSWALLNYLYRHGNMGPCGCGAVGGRLYHISNSQHGRQTALAALPSRGKAG
jgi:hypothetical protein